MMICISNPNAPLGSNPHIKQFLRDLPFSVNIDGGGENEVELLSKDRKKKITINFYKETIKVEKELENV